MYSEDQVRQPEKDQQPPRQRETAAALAVGDLGAPAAGPSSKKLADMGTCQCGRMGVWDR